MFWLRISLPQSARLARSGSARKSPNGRRRNRAASDSERGQQALHHRVRSGPASLVLRERHIQDRADESRRRQLRRVRHADAESKPIGITPAADGALWFCENAGNRIGRITTAGAITEFPVPTPGAGPDGIVAGPDGNLWFSEAHLSQVGRITPAGEVTEFSEGLTPGCRPLSPVVRNGDHLVQRIRSRADRPHHHGRPRHGIPNPDAELASRAPWPRIPTATSGSSRPRPTRSGGSTRRAASPNGR